MLWQDPHQTYHCFVTFLQIRVPLGWRADNKKAHQVFSAKIYWLSDDVGTRPARQWNPLPFKNRYATQATLVLFLFLFLGNIVVASDSFRVVVVCRLIVRQGLKLTREGGVGWLVVVEVPAGIWNKTIKSPVHKDWLPKFDTSVLVHTNKYGHVICCDCHKTYMIHYMK